MSESEGPQRRSNPDHGPQADTASPAEAHDRAAGERVPPANPWLAPADAAAQRRTAPLAERQPPHRRLPQALGQRRVLLWLWAGAGVVSAWLLTTSLHVLPPNERGLVTTFGRYTATIGPGTNATLPWPIQQVTRFAPGKEQVLMLPDQEAETLMPTRDGELADVRALVRWRISDPRAFRYAHADGEMALRRLADSAIRAAVAETGFDELRAGNRQGEVQQRIAARIQRVLDARRAGIALGGVELTAINAPARLADTFKKIEQTEAEARKNHEAAVAYAARIRYSAETETAAFDKAYELYRIAPGVTRERIYYETIERVLRNNPVVIGGNGSTTLPAPAGATPPRPQEGQ